MRMLLRDRRRAPVAGEVEVIPIAPGVITLKATLAAVGGLLAGVGAAVVPPHLPQLVILPSLGFFLALHLAGQRARIGAIRATCTACGQPFELPANGEVWAKDVWIRCPHCAEPYQVDLTDGGTAAR